MFQHSRPGGMLGSGVPSESSHWPGNVLAVAAVGISSSRGRQSLPCLLKGLEAFLVTFLAAAVWLLLPSLSAHYCSVSLHSSQ